MPPLSFERSHLFLLPRPGGVLGLICSNLSASMVMLFLRSVRSNKFHPSTVNLWASLSCILSCVSLLSDIRFQGASLYSGKYSRGRIWCTTWAGTFFPYRHRIWSKCLSLSRILWRIDFHAGLSINSSAILLLLLLTKKATCLTRWLSGGLWLYEVNLIY